MYKCPKCFEKFSKKSNFTRHTLTQTQSCIESYSQMMSIVKKIVDQKVTKALEQQKNELTLVKDKALEKQKKEIIEMKDKEITNIVSQLDAAKTKLATTTTALEKKIARQTLIPFGTENLISLVTKQDMRDNFGLDAKGDVNLFRKIYIANTESNYRSIRLKDYARRKVEVYDKKSGWVTRDVKKVAESFVKRLADDIYSETIIALAKRKNKILRDEDMDQEDQRLEIAMLDNMNKHKSSHWNKITNSNRYYMADVCRGIVDSIAHGK